ncbi:MAG TPA: M23 family metallopeptidase [Intrasporangium sp.]|uniref:M23 family metallopeptidase n=1 Tax=Intrasporangium sp. TaxID=1925024 RepID=UPI002D7860E2|nr:M23 family metallopeptidase [Intrasporangium sp.]HET7397775.1 M23 family metallopeptidase [Intrasporangium sp.]
MGLTVACAASFTTVVVARADSVQDQKNLTDKRIATLGQQLEGTDANLARAFVNLEQTKAALPAAQQRLTAAQAAQTQAEAAQVQAEATEQRAVEAEARARARNEEVAQRLAVAQASESRATEQLTQSAKGLVASQEALDAYAAEVFQGGGSQSQLGLVFGSTSPQEFADRLVMADTASTVATDTIDTLATMRADNTSTQSYLTAVRGEIAELKRQAQLALEGAEAATAAATQAKAQAILAKDNAVTARSNAQSAKSALDTLQAQQTAYAGQLQAQRANQAKQLAQEEAESRRLQGILVERARQARIAEEQRQARLRAERAARLAAARAERERQLAAERAKAAEAARAGRRYVPKPVPVVVEPPPVVSDPTPANFLSYPANGPTTSGFGMRWHPVLQKWMLHDGLDFGIACGTPVYAAADGDIIRAGWRESGWGNQILIDHGIHRNVDLVTSYNHLSSIVKFGGHVNRGQLIGYSGTTGYSTGCHLHFGTYENGTPVNPRNWL